MQHSPKGSLNVLRRFAQCSPNAFGECSPQVRQRCAEGSLELCRTFAKRRQSFADVFFGSVSSISVAKVEEAVTVEDVDAAMVLWRTRNKEMLATFQVHDQALKTFKAHVQAGRAAANNIKVMKS